MTQPEEAPEPVFTVLRIAVACGVALAFCVGVYVLLEATRPASGLVSFSFLLVLPAAVSAFVAYVADPWGRRGLGFYLMIPIWIVGAAVVAGVLLLREGAVCIVLLLPLWVLGGMGGAALTYALRKRLKRGRLYSSALLLAPLLVLQVEPLLPTPAVTATVSRTIQIEAPPELVWPLLRDIPDVRPGEGRWNVSQDVIGIPRPLSARLVGEGAGAQRLAAWARGVRFREQITEWEPGRRMGWRFVFDDPAGWMITDRHLRPDGHYFRITTGSYTLVPLGRGRSQLVLETRYWLRTPVNGYSIAWGELFLGDIQDNLLALVKQRAESGRPDQSANENPPFTG